MESKFNNNESEENREEAIEAAKEIAAAVIEAEGQDPDGNLMIESYLGGKTESFGQSVQFWVAATIGKYYDEKEIKFAYVDSFLLATNDLLEIAGLHSPDNVIDMYNYLLENAVSGEMVLETINQGDL